MATLITVVLAVATSSLTFAIAIMTKGLFPGHDWLLYVLFSLSAALYLLAIFLGVSNWRREQRKAEPPPTPPAIRPVHQENKQTVTQQQNVYLGGSDPQAVAAEQERARQEAVVLAFMKRVHPSSYYMVEDMATGVKLTKHDTRDTLERLEAKNRVHRSSLDVPGGYIWILDDLER